MIRETKLLCFRWPARSTRSGCSEGNGAELLSPDEPSFFRRTSSEVCNAITTPDDPKRNAILAKHLARIDDLRLRRAFQAAIGLEHRPPQAASESKRQELWAGLPR